jgi:hypothetical protein
MLPITQDAMAPPKANIKGIKIRMYHGNVRDLPMVDSASKPIKERESGVEFD